MAKCRDCGGSTSDTPSAFKGNVECGCQPRVVERVPRYVCPTCGYTHELTSGFVGKRICICGSEMWIVKAPPQKDPTPKCEKCGSVRCTVVTMSSGRGTCSICGHMYRSSPNEAVGTPSNPYKRILLHHGPQAQIYKTIEEMSELTLALLHHVEKKATVAEVITEIADVTIMAKQMALLFGEREVELEVERKLKRTIERMGT